MRKYSTAKLNALEYLGCVCVRCGCNDPDCLSFHHIDPEAKTDSVARLIKQAEYHDDWTQALQAELDKCEILCMNCHTKLHIANPLLRKKPGPRQYNIVPTVHTEVVHEDSFWDRHAQGSQKSLPARPKPRRKAAKEKIAKLEAANKALKELVCLLLDK